MSREIKFAFWHNWKKEMWGVDSINWVYKEVWNGGDGASLNDGVLLQYTGFVDKNGKKIYEGDVVKSNNNHLFVINFKYGSFGANWIKDDFVWHSFATNSFIEKKFEIVGNIYENPKLITEEK